LSTHSAAAQGPVARAAAPPPRRRHLKSMQLREAAHRSLLSAALRRREMLASLWNRASTAYRAKVGRELSNHGLLYEDCLIETEEVKLALKRLPPDVLNAREQRLKRAMVLSSQIKTLPPEVAEKLDPFESYLGPYLEQVKKEKEELLLTK